MEITMKDLIKRTAIKYVEKEYCYDLRNYSKRDELCKKVLLKELKDLNQMIQDPLVLKQKERIKTYLTRF